MLLSHNPRRKLVEVVSFPARSSHIGYIRACIIGTTPEGTLHELYEMPFRWNMKRALKKAGLDEDELLYANSLKILALIRNTGERILPNGHRTDDVPNLRERNRCEQNSAQASPG